MNIEANDSRARNSRNFKFFNQHYVFFSCPLSMNPYQDAPIPKIGIPVNIGISAVIGALVGMVGEDIELGISTGVLIGMTLGFFFQEALLVQILSLEIH